MSFMCQSAYGQDIIFFSSQKKCRKFHFQMYLLCCSTTYACIHLRVHAKNNSNMADVATPILWHRHQINKEGIYSDVKHGKVTAGGNSISSGESGDVNSDDEAAQAKLIHSYVRHVQASTLKGEIYSQHR